MQMIVLKKCNYQLDLSVKWNSFLKNVHKPYTELIGNELYFQTLHVFINSVFISCPYHIFGMVARSSSWLCGMQQQKMILVNPYWRESFPICCFLDFDDKTFCWIWLWYLRVVCQKSAVLSFLSPSLSVPFPPLCMHAYVHTHTHKMKNDGSWIVQWNVVYIENMVTEYKCL